MRYIVIGLGNFGSTLACRLTDMGHDVIGVDSNEHRIDDIKEKISVSYIMDATDKIALKSLPLDEVDCVVVSIGQSMDSSLRIVAALKELKTRLIYARALDLTHKSILKAMDIQKIFIPESLAAGMIAERFSSNNEEESV